MADEILTTLQARFGFDGFLPGQREVIEHLLAGRSAAAVFPTGGGKSVCYQLPALLLEGVTLVVSPLIALMKDQIDALAARGIAAARLDSTLSVEGYRDVLGRLRGGELRLLYVAPERFQNERFRQLIGQIRVALFAIDEAHCISEWGHNFRPDYLKLVHFAHQCRAERLLALTATATPAVLDDICRAFAIGPGCAVRNSCYRPNLTLLTTPVAAAERDALLADRLRQRPRGPAIVYVTLQRTAELVAERLGSNGFAAEAYHAGMEDEQRAQVQERFMLSRDGIVVATIAFGMGIDKADIRYVYHYNLPKSVESYSQEIGRAGRDGQPATCEMFVCVDDLNQLENFIYGDTPTRQAVERLVEMIFSLGPEFDVSYYELSAQSDIRVLVVRTLLTYLELDGYLAGGTPLYSTYEFKPLRSSAEILAEFEGERRRFLERLFRQATRAKTWCQIDLEQSARRLHEPRDRLVRALDYLAERGWLELRPSGVRNRYRRLKLPEDHAALAAGLQRRMLEREEQEIARLGQVLALAEEPDCQVAALCRHFGDSHGAACGHCTRCLGPAGFQKLPRRESPPIDAQILDRVDGLRVEYPILADPAVAARWLSGISSPAISRAKLSGHALFGVLAEQPFADVCARLRRDE